MRNNHIPILVILMALLFLMEALGFIKSSSVAVVWPILLGIGGIAMLKHR